MTKTIESEEVETIRTWLSYDKESLDTIYETLDFLIGELQSVLSSDNKDLQMNLINSIKWWTQRIKHMSERLDFTIKYLDTILD